MKLFDLVPERLFSVLTSSKKELYIEALFVIREAFRSTSLVIGRNELLFMLGDALEGRFETADFTEEQQEAENDSTLSSKVHLLLNHLIKTGWIEEETGVHFERNITVPDYAVAIINLLYELTHMKTGEYNSYVYSTYAALKNAEENREYMFQALSAAFRNTENLVDQLKILFNNIKRYQTRALESMDIANLMKTHFVEYKDVVFDAVYYPLKTMDSIPRFRGTIIEILNSWYGDDETISLMVQQGIARRIYQDEESAQDDIRMMINFIANTFEGIESMVREIDRKHSEYTRVAVEKVRYMLNNDLSVRGHLVDLLKKSDDERVLERMRDSIQASSYGFADQRSVYSRVRRSRSAEGEPLRISEEEPQVSDASFFRSLLGGYDTAKVDAYVDRFLKDKEAVTEDVPMENTEDFILFMLSTFRGKQKQAGYTVSFAEGYIDRSGYHLPQAVFRRKP